MKSRLDQLVVDVEFLLISVVQGLALAALANSALYPINTLQYQYWPYIISGLILILFFWSQAIIHSISFVSWPLSLVHNFLYFIATFVEVVAFSHLTEPHAWYLANAVFFGVAWLLYFVDLQLIKNRAVTLGDTLSEHALKEQRLGVYVFVPLGILFNLIAWYQIRGNEHLHLAFALIQAGIGLLVLLDSIRRFKKWA